VRALFGAGLVSLLAWSTGQAGAAEAKDDVKDQLRQLIHAYNEAGSRKDRAALERLFADEYRWVQANGTTVDKVKHIDGIMANEAPFSVPVSDFEDLLVYGDVAIHRGRFPGGVTSTVYAKKDGRWQFVQAQSTRLPPERAAVAIDSKALDALLGRYELGPGALATVTRDGAALWWQGGRRPKVRLKPLSPTRFFAEDTDLEMTFAQDDKGQVTQVTLRQGACQDSVLKRVESRTDSRE